MYIGQWCLNPIQSRHFGTSHSSPNRHHIRRCPVIFSWISSMVWNLLPFDGNFSFGKSQKSQDTKSGLPGAESPGWFDVPPKNSAGDMMREQAHCGDEAANHQLPIAAAFWIIQVQWRNVQAWCKIWCRVVALLAQSFWMWWPHSTHAHSTASTAPTD